MNGETISIAVIDDHPIFLAGMVRILNEQPGFRVVAEGKSAADAIRIAMDKRPDVMILDVSMPGNGLDAARSIIEAEPAIKIMLLTVMEDDSLVASALKAGAKGYALKGISATELIDVIWSMQRGESFVSPELAAQILSRNSYDSQSRQVLSEDDRRLLSLLAAGHSRHEIANKLSVQLSVVQRSIALLLAKLQTDTSKPPASRIGKRLLH